LSKIKVSGRKRGEKGRTIVTKVKQQQEKKMKNTALAIKWAGVKEPGDSVQNSRCVEGVEKWKGRKPTSGHASTIPEKKGGTGGKKAANSAPRACCFQVVLRRHSIDCEGRYGGVKWCGVGLTGGGEGES